ncbi:SHE4 [Candida jiufengensis]|uniref:SHE4 n=1 Tax=Candida jiufengensis TaxID=497108 RepID=UPI002225AB58|nr:SHE4 [Candida jiufengensis]KAI5951511.1 SHE4 [Candida jiufengensis]
MSNQEEITSQIKSLKLDSEDDTINKLFKEALTTELNESDQKIIKDSLHRSLSKEKSGVLLNLLQNNAQQFIILLKNVNDSGTILADITHKHSIAEIEIQKLLSAIRSEVSQNKNVDYYLGLYSNIISNFKFSNCQHLSLLLSLIGRTKKTDNLILVIIIQNLQLNKIETESIIQEYFELQIEEKSFATDQFINFISTLSLCFPICPELCAKIYMDDRTKEITLSKLNTSNDLLILKCFSNSCLVENCRTYTVNNYFQFLLDCFKSTNVHKRILASLVLVKLWSFIEVEKKTKLKVTNLAEDLILYIDDKNEIEYIEYSIEGLIYLSLFWEVREMMRMDISFIENLLKILQNSSTENNVNTSIQYGVLSIIANLTKLKEPEQNQRNKLKNVTSPQTGSQSQEESQENIKLFNKELLEDDKIISVLTKLKTYQNSSTNNLNEVINIVYNISFDQLKSIRIELVKQGALKIVINYLVKYSEIERIDNRVIANPLKDDLRPEVRLKAIRSLARMLICIKPQLTFEHFDIKSAIPFLIELLGSSANDQISSYSDELSPLDKYESLLALTNTASINDSSLKIFIIYEILPYVDSLILQSLQIQISTYELLNNLISEPILLSKFFNVATPQNKQRLEITLKLLNSDEIKLQVVIAGFLVNATNFDMISDVIVNSKEIFDDLFGTIQNIITNQVNDEKLITPISYILLNLSYTLANKSRLSVLKSNAFINGCESIIKNGSEENKEVISNILELCNNNT